MKNYKYQIVWFLLSVCGLAYTSWIYSKIKVLEARKTPAIEVKITAKSCTAFIGSSAFFDFEGKEIALSIPRKLCNSSAIGDKITLIYDEEHDIFYLPGTIRKYKREIELSVISMLLSLVPWRRFKAIKEMKETRL